MGTVEVPKLLIWFFIIILLVMLPLATRGAYQLLRKKGFLKVGSKTRSVQTSVTNIDEIRKQYHVQYQKRVKREIREIARQIKRAVKHGESSIMLDRYEYTKEALNYFKGLSYTVHPYTAIYQSIRSGSTREEDVFKISW